MPSHLELASASSSLFFTLYNTEFYFGAIAFLLSLAVGVFYIIDWGRNHRSEKEHAGLLWGFGLFFSLWFQIPFLYANAGLEIVVSNFHPLFSAMLPVCFLGLALIYRGVRGHLGGDMERLNFSLSAWFVLCSAYFAYCFYHWQQIDSYFPIVVGGSLFFFVIFGLLLAALITWYRRTSAYQYPYTLVGIILFLAATLLQMSAGIMALLAILRLSPDFWFLAIMSSPTAFVLQAISAVLLSMGIHYIHREQSPHNFMDQLRSIKKSLPR